MNEITFICPDDWHVHLRDNTYLERTVKDTAHAFHRAIVMPNLVPPVTTVDLAAAYLKRIKTHIPRESTFTPLMTLYLTDTLSPSVIEEAKQSNIIVACKLYPAGATTHSANGVRDIHKIYPLLETMQALQIPLLVHGETIDPNVDIFDREAVFITEQLIPLCKNFPTLPIVFEHISTKIATEFILSGPENLAATVTPHHLLLNRNDLLVGGLRPHHYCLPIIKSPADQAALIKAVLSGNPKFFLGSDSAPHTQSSKESCCGSAGIYSAFTCIELYAAIFEQHHALNKLENFASRFGAEFYGLPINTQTITLIKKPWIIPASLPFGNEVVIPLFAGKTIHWQIKNIEKHP